MRRKKFLTHILGSILILSTIYHSDIYYSISVFIPFLIVSYSVHQEKSRLIFPSLIFATLFSTFFITAGSMNEIFSLSIFLISFALPLFVFWLVVLLDELEIKFFPLVTGLSYVFFTVLAFYLIPEVLGLSEFILSPGNRGPQILLFLGVGMIVAVPYHIILDRNG